MMREPMRTWRGARRDGGQAVAEYVLILVGLVVGVAAIGLYRQMQVGGRTGTFMELLTGTYRSIVEDITLLLSLPF